MVNPLPVTKGITSAVVTNIPKQWSAEWFRYFVINFLQNMDIRNTVNSTSSTNIVEGASVNTSVTEFSATEGGTVPASGGGTVNFLRADKTWAVPSGGGGGGSPGGANTDIQFNNSGTFGGSGSLTWNGSTLAVSGTVSATELDSASDPCLKKDIEPIEDSSRIINGLTGYRFSWKESGKPSMGILSTQVRLVAPELVSRFQNHDVVNYNGLVAILIEEVKSLRQRVAKLERAE